MKIYDEYIYEKVLKRKTETFNFNDDSRIYITHKSRDYFSFVYAFKASKHDFIYGVENKDIHYYFNKLYSPNKFIFNELDDIYFSVLGEFVASHSDNNIPVVTFFIDFMFYIDILQNKHMIKKFIACYNPINNCISNYENVSDFYKNNLLSDDFYENLYNIDFRLFLKEEANNYIGLGL